MALDHRTSQSSSIGTYLDGSLNAGGNHCWIFWGNPRAFIFRQSSPHHWREVNFDMAAEFLGPRNKTTKSVSENNIVPWAGDLMFDPQ